MTPSERGDRAKQILDDAVFAEMFEHVRASIVAQLESSAFGDAETHHQAAISLQLLKRLRDTLVRFVDVGKAEQIKQRDAEFSQTVRKSIRRP